MIGFTRVHTREAEPSSSANGCLSERRSCSIPTKQKEPYPSRYGFVSMILFAPILRRSSVLQRSRDHDLQAKGVDDSVKGACTGSHRSVLNLGNIAFGGSDTRGKFCLCNTFALSYITKNLAGVESICFFFCGSSFRGALRSEPGIQDNIVVPYLIVIYMLFHSMLSLSVLPSQFLGAASFAPFFESH